jgi:adenylate kinase
VKSRIVLLGAPGSGKGTQAEMITRHFAISVTSPGTILRRERELGTPLGLDANEISKQGGLVPDDVIVHLIEDWLNLHGQGGFVFDGFPRTVKQAERLNELLQKMGTSLDLAIWLEVSEEKVRARIASRLQCRRCGFTTSLTSAGFADRPSCPYCDGPLIRRDDDDASVLQTRLAEFKTKTEPLLSFYEKDDALHRIDGNRDREAVFSDISALIEERAKK